MTRLRSTLPPLPARMKALPIDHRGFPVPFFATWIDGKAEFRFADRQKLHSAIRHRLCWICGQPLGRIVAFAIGPMCSVNRVSAEPPQHRDCAIFAVTACPFMVNPDARRRESGIPEGAGRPEDCAGIALKRNPGAVAVWICREWGIFDAGGPLHRLGEPLEVLWYTRGRPATRDEIEYALETGFPALQEVAELQGPAAVQAAEHALRQVRATLLPAA